MKRINRKIWLVAFCSCIHNLETCYCKDLIVGCFLNYGNLKSETKELPWVHKGHTEPRMHPAESSASLTPISCQHHNDFMGSHKGLSGRFMRWFFLVFISHPLPDLPLWIPSADHLPQGEPWHRLRVLRPRGEEGCGEGEGEAGWGGVGNRKASAQGEEQGAGVRKSGISSQ